MRWLLLFQSELNFKGRLTRFSFFIRILFFTFFANLLASFEQTIPMPAQNPSIGTLLSSFILLLFSVVLSVWFFSFTIKRLHDTDKAAKTLLWLAVPVGGAVYILLRLFFFNSKATNDYGPNPKVRQDYLIVQ